MIDRLFEEPHSVDLDRSIGEKAVRIGGHDQVSTDGLCLTEHCLEREIAVGLAGPSDLYERCTYPEVVKNIIDQLNLLTWENAPEAIGAVERLPGQDLPSA